MLLMKTNKGSTGNKHRPEADARVLGRILAAQNIEFVLPNTTHIAEFFAETLMSIPGVLSCRVCLEDISIQRGEMGSGICEECVSSRRKSAEQKELPLFNPDFKCRLADHSGVQFNAINSLHHHFGYFVFQIDDPDVFNVYKPFIVNLANYVAISLENRQQRDLLQKAHDDLEHKVEKRTQELRASNEAIKDLYNNAPCGYHSLDKDGIFILVNDTELQWLGYSRDETVGKVAFQDLLTADGLKTFETNFQSFKERGWVSDLEFEMVRKDGTILPVLLNATAINDDNGNYVMSRSTIFDITARKQAGEKLQERERHSQSLLRLSRNLERSQTYAEVLNAAQDEVRNIIGYQNLWAYLLTDDKKHFKALVAGGLVEDIWMTDENATMLTITGDRMLEEIAEARDIVVVEDARTDERTDKAIVASLGNRTIVNIPIILFDKHLGTVGTGTFGDEGVRVPAKAEQEYLMALASHMAVSLDRIHLLNKRRQAEQSLRESEERFRSFVEKANDIVYTISPDGVFTYVSPNWKEILGHETSEVEGRLFEVFVHPDDLAACREVLSRAILSGEKQSGFEYRVKHKNGSWQWHTSNSSVIRDRDNRIISFLGIARNITERKHAEDALRRLNRELRAISNCNQTLMRAVDEQTLLNDICHIVCDEAGYRMAWVGFAENDDAKTVRPVAWAGWEDGYLAAANLTWDDTERGRGPTGVAIRSGESISIQDFMTAPQATPWRETALQRGYRSSIALPLKDEGASTFGVLSIYSAEPNAFTSDEIRLLEELAGDLAFGIVALRTRVERDRAEESLRESERRLAESQRIAHIGYWERDYAAETITLSEESCQIFGLPLKNRFLKLPEWHVQWTKLIHPEDQPGVAQVLVDALRGDSPYNVEYRIIQPGGEMRFIHSEAIVKRDAAGRPRFMLGMMQDITERKRNERELIILNHAINQSSDAVFLINEQLIFAYVNDAACRSLEYTREELLTMNPSDIDAVVTYETAKDIMNKLFAGGYYPRFETQHKTRSGRIFPVEISFSQVEYDGAKFSLTTVHDITERKQGEDALRRSEQKFRALAENTPNVVYQCKNDSRYTFIYLNNAVEDLSGYPKEEFLENGLSFFDLYHPDDLLKIPKPENNHQSLLNRRSFHVTYRIRHRSGEWRWVDEWGTGVMSAHGDVEYLEGIMIDITDTKHHELEREAIITVSTALRQSTTRTEILSVLLDQLVKLFDVDGAMLVLPHPETGGFIDELGRGAVAENMTGLYIPPGKGVCNWVITNKKPYFNNHADNDPLFYRPDLLGDSHCLASVPLIAQEQAIGAVWIARQVDILERDLLLLVAIADIAANAIHRVMLHEQTEQQLRHLIALHQIDLAISTNFDSNLTITTILKNVKDELEVDAASILLLNPITHTLDYAAGIGFKARGIEQSQVKIGDEWAGRAAQEYQTVSCPDLKLAGETFGRSSLLAFEAFVAHYATPLIVKGQVKGVLELFHRNAFKPTAEWIDYFETLATQTAIAIESSTLFENLQRSNMELMLAYDATIEGWSRALDLRDKETEGHTQRVTEIALDLAGKMGMSETEKQDLWRGALLHDIGKMGVPDSILNKPGPLSDDEREIMRQHPPYAHQMLSQISYLKHALDIPFCHHEKWDGSGYPRGLKGEEIPLSARLFAVVDVYDALTSDRPYRKAWSREDAYRYIEEQSGKHFDPQVVKIFLENKPSWPLDEI